MTTKHVNLRLEPEMHNKLVDMAERKRRSMNGQIEVYIEEGLARDDAPALPSKIIRTAHDLNDVTEIRILGWTGGSHIKSNPAADEHWVCIEAPQQHADEIWTFSQQRDGVLTCFSSLIGELHLLRPSTQTMTVYLPADRMDDVTVTFETPKEHQ